MSAPSTSATPAKRRRSSRRPPARRSSTSRMSRRRRRARRSWCRRTARSRSVADLKGKKVALNKGSNVHYLLVKALEKAGVKYSEIEPVFLAPADARAAFERGAVDAWVIWDPFQAAAEVATGARTLADGTGLVANHQFYLAAAEVRRRQPARASTPCSQQLARDRRLGQGQRQGGRRSSSARRSAFRRRSWRSRSKRQTYGIKPLDDDASSPSSSASPTPSTQLGLIPKPINISDAS